MPRHPRRHAALTTTGREAAREAHASTGALAKAWSARRAASDAHAGPPADRRTPTGRLHRDGAPVGRTAFRFGENRRREVTAGLALAVVAAAVRAEGVAPGVSPGSSTSAPRPPTSVVKHADAASVRVVPASDWSELTLRFSDDGRGGADPAGAGLGLA